MPFACHAYCGDATVTWSEDAVRYTIGLKLGTRAELVDAADSVTPR